MRRLFLFVVVLCLPFASPVAADDGIFIPGAPIDLTSVNALISSVYSLADVDMLTGTYLGDITAVPTFGYDTVALLSDSNAMAFDVQLAAEQARTDIEARKRLEEERIAAEARARAARAQTEVGPEGCPTSAPPRTLRGGSEGVGAHELCVASVASASSPAAAQAVKYVFVNLGVPYSRTDRMGENAYDCSSYVMRAYESAGVPVIPNGWAPTTHRLAPYSGYESYPWLVTVSYANALPGDLLMRPPSATRDDGGGHVAMLLDMGFMVHTASTGDVSHVTLAYRESELFNVRRVSP